MPKFTIIQQPQQNEKQHKQKKQELPIYVERLRQVLQNNKKNHNRCISQDKYFYWRNQYKNQYTPHRYQTQKSDNQEQSVLYILKNEKKERQNLPKLKKKHKPSLRHTNIDNNDKMIIKNYMNAKLIQYKQPELPKKKGNKTIDCSNQLSANKNKKYYRIKKNTPVSVSTPTYIIKDNFNHNEQNQRYPKTLKIDKLYEEDSSILEKKLKQCSKSIQTGNGQLNKNHQNGCAPHELTGIHNQLKKTKSQNGWQYIDPLNLQTYFIKLKRIGQNSPIVVSMADVALKTKHSLPEIPSSDSISCFIKNYIPQFEEIKIEQLIKCQNFQIIQEVLMGKNQFYFGQVKHNFKHGLGILLTDKCVFEGIFNNNSKIRGIQIIQHGKYKGEFKDGKRCGKGQFFWNNGEYYEGEWKNGKKHGSGYWKSNKGESYIGEWSNGQVTGYGVHTMKNGQKYEGEFTNFLKHGYGREIFPNGDIYEGRYANGQPNGKGKYFWKNGTYYEGDFVEGFREGQGILTAPNRLQLDGNFKGEIIFGIGRLKMSNGDVYNGMFENNMKNGHGILELKSEKKIIKGIWADNHLIGEEN